MATVFLEGFDKYGASGTLNTPLSTLLANGGWTVGNASGNFPELAAGLNGTSGQCVFLSTGSSPMYLRRSLGANKSRVIGGARVNWTFSSSSSPSPGIAFLDGTTYQSCIAFNSTGTISVRTGGFAGTVLGTSGSTALPSGATHYIEWDFTFAGSGAGTYNVYVDGTLVLTGSGTTISTANAYANNIEYNAGNANISATIKVDDLYTFDTSGSFNNAVILNSNTRVDTKPVSSDSAVTWTFGAAVLGTAYQGVTSTNAPGANTLFLKKFTPASNGTISSISCIPGATSAGASFQAVMYTDSAGAAGTLLSASSTVVGTTSGTALNISLTTPQSVTAGTSYWLGFITDTSVVLQECDASNLGFSVANTFGSGAPGTAPAMSSAKPSWIIYGNFSSITGSFNSVNVTPALGDISQVNSDTVGQEDLYNVSNLDTTVVNIWSVQVSACFKALSAGHTIDVRLKSVTTDSAGSASGFTPSTTAYQWSLTLFDTDPATSTTWTTSARNSLKAGMKVAS